MNVKVQTSELPQSQISLAIEVDPSLLTEAMDVAFAHFAQSMNIPGFRKGKAPRAVLERAIGPTAVIEEASDIVINRAYKDALEQTGLKPIAVPEVELEEGKLDLTQPLNFKVKIYVQPKVTLGDFRSIRVDPPVTAVGDEQIAAVLNRLAEQQAVWGAVEEGSAQELDITTISLRATVDGEVVIDSTDQEQYLAPSGSLEPNTLNLTQFLIGMSVGESKDVEAPLPDSFDREELRGKMATCHLGLERIERRVSPVIDDAFAQSVGEYESLEALREIIRTDAEAQQRVADAEAFVEQVTSAAVALATVDVPPPLIEDEIQHTIDTFTEELQVRQGLSLDLYLRVTKKTMEDMRKELKEPALSRVKSNLMLEAVAEALSTQVNSAEVDAELQSLMSLPNLKEKERRRILTSSTVRERIEMRLRRRLALQELLVIANPRVNSADTTQEGDNRQIIQEAGESHANALDSSFHSSNLEENAE